MLSQPAQYCCKHTENFITGEIIKYIDVRNEILIRCDKSLVLEASCCKFIQKYPTLRPQFTKH